jgi:hypothetical protein
MRGRHAAGGRRAAMTSCTCPFPESAQDAQVILARLLHAHVFPPRRPGAGHPGLARRLRPRHRTPEGHDRAGRRRGARSRHRPGHRPRRHRQGGQARRRLRRIRERRLEAGHRDPGRPRQPEHRLLRLREGGEAPVRPGAGAGESQSGGRHERTQDRRLLRGLHGRGRHRSARHRPAATEAGRGERDQRRRQPVPLPRRRHACRHRPAQRHQLLHREPVRPVRGAGPGRSVEERRLPDAGRPGHAGPRVLPRRRQGHGGESRRLPGLHRRHARARRRRRCREQGEGDLRPRDEDRQGARQRGRQPGHPQDQQSVGGRRLREECAGHRLDGVLRCGEIVRPADDVRLAAGRDQEALSALVASEPLQAWKDYLHFHAINHSAGAAAQGVCGPQLRVLWHPVERHQPAARPLEACARPRPTVRSATPSASCT